VLAFSLFQQTAAFAATAKTINKIQQNCLLAEILIHVLHRLALVSDIEPPSDRIATAWCEFVGSFGGYFCRLQYEGPGWKFTAFHDYGPLGHLTSPLKLMGGGDDVFPGKTGNPLARHCRSFWITHHIIIGQQSP